MAPLEAFSMSAAHACVEGTIGCAAGIHSEILSWTSLSCACAAGGVSMIDAASTAAAPRAPKKPRFIRSSPNGLRLDCWCDQQFYAEPRGPHNWLVGGDVAP